MRIDDFLTCEIPAASPGSLTSLTAFQTATLIRQKELSPVEVVDAYLNRIQQTGPPLNAFATICFDEARVQARLAEAAVMRQVEAPPLLGVPITVKSCIDVKGIPCEAGSLLRRGHVPATDATLVARLRRAGAIILGNTCTPEMLMAYDTDNQLHGRTSNPWDLARTAGGSSGGESAAIAAGLSAAGVGSDGGGSIRVPAHFCGICGLKPTPGRIPGTGHFPAGLGPFSLTGVVGPMARTVSDLRLLLHVMSGYDPGDPVSCLVPVEDASDGMAPDLRIGFYEDDGITFPSPDIRRAVRLAATTLADLGFAVEPFRPEGLDEACKLWADIFIDAGAMLLRPMVADSNTHISPTLHEFLAAADRRPRLTAERLLNTLIKRDQLRNRVLSQMQHFPILLCPVSSVSAFKHGEGGWGEQYPVNYLSTMTYSQQFNLLGNPAAVVPVGQSAEGLPVGIQVVGRPYKEDEVLAVAELLDRTFGWKQPPQIHLET